MWLQFLPSLMKAISSAYEITYYYSHLVQALQHQSCQNKILKTRFLQMCSIFQWLNNYLTKRVIPKIHHVCNFYVWIIHIPPSHSDVWRAPNNRIPGKVTHSDPIVFCHQVKRVDFLAARFQPLGQLCLSAPKICDNRRVFSLSDALHNQV